MGTACRIIDANFNRSREALRVMEEFARFVLDDATLTQAIKTARHDLASTIKKLARNEGEGGHGPPYGHRDIVGDVGAEISTPSELHRVSEAAVVHAACKRLSESLRVLEEYGKVLDAEFAARMEKLRYRAYELERRLLATIHAREKFAGVRLYVLITESLCSGNWFETARGALVGGADCIQLREKNLADRELLERAKRLAQLCRDMERILIVNDRPDIALAAGAHGAHLGQDDMPVSAARRMLPARMMVGLSTHTIEQVEAAIALAPDYIAVGPMFDSLTSPTPRIAGPGLLAEARKRTALPLVAIGGIDEQNIGMLLPTTPVCICVCRAVISQPDPANAARRLREHLGDTVLSPRVRAN